MNRIVREHVPASELPEGLRGDIDPSAVVTVTIEQEEDTRVSADHLREMVQKYRANIVGTGVSAEEAATRIRGLRDEWDD